MTAPPLRPLGVGDIVDRVIGMYRADWRLFLTVSAVPNLVVILLTNAFSLAFPRAFGTVLSGDELLGTGGDLEAVRRLAEQVTRLDIGVILLFAVLSILPTVVAIGALIAAANARALGRPVAAGEALALGLRASGRLVAVALIGALTAVVVWASLSTVALLITTVVGAFAIVFVLVAFGVPLFLLASWATAPVIATLEAAGAVASLRRAWKLSDGYRSRTLGLFVLLVFVQLALSALFGLLLIGPLVASPTVGRVASAIVSGLVTIAWEPVPWAALTLLYLDLRVRKEGLDLQLAAEALAREP